MRWTTAIWGIFTLAAASGCAAGDTAGDLPTRPEGGERSALGIDGGTMGPSAWTPAGPMIWPRAQTFGLALLPSGRVLAVGADQPNAEAYDPATDTWSPFGPPDLVRYWVQPVVLADGRVLVSGGELNTPASSAVLYDESLGTWTKAAALHVKRMSHTATLLLDGRVLVAGGYSANMDLIPSVEIYDPVADTWTEVAPMHHQRAAHAAARLADGRVIVVNGTYTSAWKSVEIYDPTLDAWTEAAPSGSWHTPQFRAYPLPDGRVIVLGPTGSDPSPPTDEIYDPVLDTWTPAPQSPNESHNTSVQLADGSVLVTGGFHEGNAFAYAARNAPSGGGWASAGEMPVPRADHRSILMADGRVLVAGGDDGPNAIAPCAIYDPNVTSTGGAGGSSSSSSTASSSSSTSSSTAASSSSSSSGGDIGGSGGSAGSATEEDGYTFGGCGCRVGGDAAGGAWAAAALLSASGLLRRRTVRRARGRG